MRLGPVSNPFYTGRGNLLMEGARSVETVSDRTASVVRKDLRIIEVALFLVLIRGNRRVGIELWEYISALTPTPTARRRDIHSNTTTKSPVLDTVMAQWYN
jgi:hypothetical protein